ncbi:MAG: hypothetical protein ACJ77G_08780 [Solirubrobacteraceae bacterium]
MSPSPKLRSMVAVVLAGGALGVGVPAALAATGGNDAASIPSTTQSAPGAVQDDSATPRDHDCPGRDGGGAQQGGATAPDSGSDTTPSL